MATANKQRGASEMATFFHEVPEFTREHSTWDDDYAAYRTDDGSDTPRYWHFTDDPLREGAHWRDGNGQPLSVAVWLDPERGADEMTAAPRYPYLVVDAPGFYGREGRVYSRHRTLSAARRALGQRHAELPGQGRRQIAVVAHNPVDPHGYEGGQYRAGSTFWGDSPPLQVGAEEETRW